MKTSGLIWIFRLFRVLRVTRLLRRYGMRNVLAELVADPELILALSKLDPPPYVAMTVRGDASGPSDFDRGMTAYARKDFNRAADLLAKASAGDPDAATHFFLGISRLMIEDPSGAAVALRRCIALGSSPYAQAARVALAKALLRTNDLTEAERALADATLLPGDEAAEAKQLLERLQKGRAATP